MLKRISDMLRSMFRSSAPPKEDGARETATRLEKKVLALVDNMPTLPDTATRAMALANDPDTKFADFAQMIEGDASIATGLLRVANSAIYAGGSPAMKLQQAVVRMGMWQCKNLILAIGMKSLFQKMAGDTKEQCELLWHHGYVTGFLCRQINRAYRLGFEGEEFSAGLLHDLGRILLVLADRECFTRAGAMSFHDEPDRLERERAAIGIDHCALGGWFGEHSKLPDTLILAMKHHHEPRQAESAERLVALVAAADHMANHLQRNEDAPYDAEDNIGLAYLWARWPVAKKERFLGEIPSLIEESATAASAAHSPS